MRWHDSTRACVACSPFASASTEAFRRRSKKSAPVSASPASACGSSSHVHCASCAWRRQSSSCICARNKRRRLHRSHHLHLAEPRETAQALELDLPHALAGEPEPPADLLERLRLFVDEAVAQDEYLPLAVGQRLQRNREGLAAKRDLDSLLR